MDGFVTEHVQEVILGLDWLQSQEALWDFKTGKLIIGGDIHLLLDSSKSMFCRGLVIQEPITFPARSEVDVPTMVIFHNMSAAKLSDDGM